MKKRICSILLAMIAVVFLLPTVAFAAGGDYDVDIVASKFSTIQYNGKDTMKIDFMIQTDNGAKATCMASGVKAHWHCEVCGGNYLEKTVTAEAQTAKALEIPKDMTNHVSDGKTLQYDDTHHWGACSCETPIDKTPHSGGEATCKDKAICSVCKAEYGAKQENNHKGQTELRGKKEPTCTEKGYTGDTWCLDCNTKIATGEEIPVKHTLQAVSAVAANCKNPGNKEHWKCIAEGCGKLFSDDKATAEVTADSVVIPANPEAHVWDEGKVTKQPTTDAEGEKTFTCTVEGCGVTKIDPIPKLSNPTITPVGPNPKPQKPTEPTEPAKPAFGDIAGEWFEADVKYVFEKGLMNGVGDGSLFAPNMNTSRGMIVTILWRMEGQPVPMTANTFKDVEKGAYYEQAVAWAAEKGIVNGYGDTFGPNDNITREQFATILFRYAQYKGYDVSVGEDTNILSYADAFSVSEYAIPAMQWACGAGLINGNGDQLMPTGVASRAQAAAILHRFCENVK